MAFLEVITRCYRRPQGLAKNQASLRAQHDPDWTQTLLVDEIGIGVEAANAQLADVTPNGDYVWVLDDDDYCIDPYLVARLKMAAEGEEEMPPAFVVQMDHGALGVLPDERHWGGVPPEGGIGASALITRRDVWMRYRDRYASGRYASDYDFAEVALRSEYGIVWLRVVASAISRRSVGRAEVHA